MAADQVNEYALYLESLRWLFYFHKKRDKSNELIE